MMQKFVFHVRQQFWKRSPIFRRLIAEFQQHKIRFTSFHLRILTLSNSLRHVPRASFHGAPVRWATTEPASPPNPAGPPPNPIVHSSSSETKSFSPSKPGPTPTPSQTSSNRPDSLPPDWDESPDYDIHAFSELPSTNFGVNQHIAINKEFREALRLIIWQFRAPVRYAFAYGSGVFPQTASKSASSSSIHPNPSPAISSVQGGNGKMIDFIFGVSYSQHWHSINLQQHRDHYSSLGSFGSSLVSRTQDDWGAGAYFNPYVTVNGTLIKYGVVNLDTLYKDLSEWDSLYLAGRLQKPVKILRDDPRIRLANQINLISAIRTALLLLPERFTERDLYSAIAGISYLGDPRMSLGAENLNKVVNMVQYQLTNFRKLYAPLIENLPNVSFNDSRCQNPFWAEDPDTNATLIQDMDPQRRGNMVRRLPKAFREKLYFHYQSKFQIPQLEFNKLMDMSNDSDPSRIRRKQGGPFEQRIASEAQDSLKRDISKVITKTIWWPSYSQSVKGLFTAGVGRSWRYMSDKWEKNREGRRKSKATKKEDSSDTKKPTN